MKSFRPYLILLSLIWVTCQSCSTDETQPTVTVRSIHISNNGKPFEYWVGKERNESDGKSVFEYFPNGTEITIGAVVEVKDNVEIIPNIIVYQDSKLVQLKQITKSFYWYKVK
jgi:hypothetical protein